MSKSTRDRLPWTTTRQPSKNTTHHLLLQPRSGRMNTLTDEEQITFLPTIAQLEKDYGLEYFSVVYRSKDPHAHLVVGEGPTYFNLVAGEEGVKE